MLVVERHRLHQLYLALFDITTNLKDTQGSWVANIGDPGQFEGILLGMLSGIAGSPVIPEDVSYLIHKDCHNIIKRDQ